jgi:dihydroorotate dehydrogenase electron transfer subunit
LAERAQDVKACSGQGVLGQGFPPPVAPRRDLLVAGGVGLAPLLFWAERHAAGGRVELFYGARSARELVLVDQIERSGAALHLATEDGSRGVRGYVTAALEARLDELSGGSELPCAEGERMPRQAAQSPPHLHACGPNAMLEAVRAIAARRRLGCHVSLEGEMACGIGACLGCAVAAHSRPYRYVCKDGPVLDAEDLR